MERRRGESIGEIKAECWKAKRFIAVGGGAEGIAIQYAPTGFNGRKGRRVDKERGGIDAAIKYTEAQEGKRKKRRNYWGV